MQDVPAGRQESQIEGRSHTQVEAYVTVKRLVLKTEKLDREI